MRLPIGVAALLMSGSVAYAQAPGDYYGEEGPTQAPGEVAPAAPAAPIASGPFHAPAHRWSVGLAFGSAKLHPKGEPEAKTQFAVAGLALRYRATRSLELEVAAVGGREQLEDGMEGDRALSSATLGLRYRFRPEAAWNWYVMAGIGATAVARHDASDEERDAASKPHGQFGLGIERRFRRFALAAEVRMTSVGERKDREARGAEPAPAPEPGPTTGTVPTEPVPEPGFQPAPDRQKGGQFTVGLSYYF